MANQNIKASLYRSLLFLILISGITIRIIVYLSNRSAWFDEAALALSIIHQPFHYLLTHPSDYTVPVGFLLMTKCLIVFLGKNEFILRIIPLASGIASLFLIYKLSSKYLPRTLALLPLFLMAVSVTMLRYTTECKQYSTDVLICLLIPLCVISFLHKKHTPKQRFILGLTGALAPYFSLPSIFMLGGAGAALLLIFIEEKNWKEVYYLLITFSFWGFAFFLNYSLFLTKIADSASLQNYWSNGFMPLPHGPSGNNPSSPPLS